MFPKTLKARQARILRYEQELRRERRRFGAYESPGLSRVRTRYVEIFKQLRTEPVGPTRTELVNEASRLAQD